MKDNKRIDADKETEHFNTVVLKLADRYNGVKGSNKIARRQEKFSKAESQILRCGEDIQSLDKFIELQRTGFRKILKKYKVSTTSNFVSTSYVLLTLLIEMVWVRGIDGSIQQRSSHP